MALLVAAINEPTTNVLDNGDAMPCPFLWSSDVKPAPALVLLVWIVHRSFLRMYKLFALDGQTIASSAVL